ncbi:MAG: hypothetical protein ACRDMY_04280 [Gaiellaceae bacterium]
MVVLIARRFLPGDGGGPVFPAIFLGIGLATLGVIAFDVTPTLAVAVGTAAGMAAMTKLLFSSLLIAATWSARPEPTRRPRRCSPAWRPG